jgi:hypothetical protein
MYKEKNRDGAVLNFLLKCRKIFLAEGEYFLNLHHPKRRTGILYC